jgi:hypothetical protein
MSGLSSPSTCTNKYHHLKTRVPTLLSPLLTFLSCALESVPWYLHFQMLSQQDTLPHTRRQVHEKFRTRDAEHWSLVLLVVVRRRRSDRKV